ncbi:fatty acid desaturase family protein [Nocardia flavorosea]|uniref:Acyl-CoA desaturase n=1 Tax=Nocardia flavorosea TaxID=53429 RepID=A0A846YKG0_9NOCA|nr:acyl-CoA desaturase [Nocardia flavorosea]NKY58261.1 acyl-CoA desaturase [Nocardia flavorosea]
MAITDIKAFSHLTEDEIEDFGRELDRIRADVERVIGERDAAYIHRAIRIHRGLETVARLMILFSGRRHLLRGAGAVVLAAAKAIEMMELGHNISHGQWDWMNDPEIHSTNWEWDFVGPSGQWKQSHNHVHHTYTNVFGMDDDLSFVVMRMTRDERWRPVHLIQPVSGIAVALAFEWMIAIHDWALVRRRHGIPRGRIGSPPDIELVRKILRQAGKDFGLFPALSPRHFKRTLAANAAALLLRNIWSYVVIMCGHFPDGAEKFTEGELANETRAQWYLRQLLGSANFSAGPVLAFMTGNLCYQIEHHLFPDLPSNRYAEIAVRVRALCAEYDLPYTSGALPAQFLQSTRTLVKLALPDRFLRHTADDAAETRSERMFRGTAGRRAAASSGPFPGAATTGMRRGLRTVLVEAASAARAMPGTGRRFRASPRG